MKREGKRSGSSSAGVEAPDGEREALIARGSTSEDIIPERIAIPIVPGGESEKQWWGSWNTNRNLAQSMLDRVLLVLKTSWLNSLGYQTRGGAILWFMWFIPTREEKGMVGEN